VKRRWKRRWPQAWRDYERWRHKEPWGEASRSEPHVSFHSPWRGWDHRKQRFIGWHTGVRQRRGLVFLRFAGAFGCMSFLLLGGMAALAFLVTRLFGGRGHMALLVWVVGIGLALAMPTLAAKVAMEAFRRIATPIADLMSAADAVAEGDLSVRVKEPSHGPEPFGRLVRSFNHMIEELQRADQRRRNLTADVAHELRTPLHIIQGNLEGILDDVYEPTEEHISATLEETSALARLVDDLRTLSLAEAGQLPLVWETVEVSDLLADVCTSFSGQAEVAGVDLTCTMDDSMPVAIMADVGRLDQVLGNLVSNALRYTPAGGHIALRAKTADGGVCITVSDTGAGILSEDLPYVFDRFWKGDRSRTRAGGGGSGLGLAIARQLVQAHGGRIAVESTVGQGTTFTIDLPLDGRGDLPL
jgi:signal transduction histidine kinase